jgi:geranylgeranylglycerol-phosphate geranylgeranyltransferase
MVALSARSVAREIISASRPHFFALPMFAALGGIAAAAGSPTEWIRPLVCVLVVGLGWGVAQLVNDLLDRDTDRVNAPDRAIVSGRLPARHALLAAGVTGVVLAAATAALHPWGWALALAGMVLILSYNFAKAQPVVGNVSLGALLALTAAMGIASALPPGGPDLVSALGRSRPLLVVVGSIAAWYLQANYEKDRRGDRTAGYRTLAVVIGVRASAVLRALGILIIAVSAWALGLVIDPVGLGILALGALVGLYSTLGPIVRGTDEAALAAYRSSVVASLLVMASLSLRLGQVLVVVSLAAALVVTESAFRRSPNP